MFHDVIQDPSFLLYLSLAIPSDVVYMVEPLILHHSEFLQQEKEEVEDNHVLVKACSGNSIFNLGYHPVGQNLVTGCLADREPSTLAICPGSSAAKMRKDRLLRNN
jgi:hypothetical protein